MADMNDEIRKRLARAEKKLAPSAPGRGFGPVGSLSMVEAEEAYVRDYSPTLPKTGATTYGGGSFQNEEDPGVKASAEAARDRFAPINGRDETRKTAIREQMERLNEAQGGGLAMFQQLLGNPDQDNNFRSQDLTTYYIEPEGRFLMARDIRGNLEAFEVSAVKNMLERQAEQHRQQGGELPRTPEKPKGPTQADANNLIANFKDRIRVIGQNIRNEKIFEGVHRIENAMTDQFVATASKLPGIGVDVDEGKVPMVLAISTYGREEGVNMVRELREKGGEIEQHNLSYKVDGETFTRTHPDKKAYDYNAAEIEQAIDVRQKELEAIGVWESKADEPMAARAVSEETLDALAALDNMEPEEPAMTAQEIAADDKRILQERFERHLLPDDGSEPELTSHERREADARERRIEEASLAQDQARELGENIAAYGQDRGTDLISELRKKGGEIEHDGATYVLDGNRLTRTLDGETTKHDAYDVKDGIDHQREDEQQSMEAAMSPYERMEAGLSRPDNVSEKQWDGLRQQYEHNLVMENTPEEFYRGESANDFYRDDPVEVYEQEQQGLKLDANRTDAPELHDDPEEADYQAAAPHKQPNEVEALKAQIAALQEKLAAYEKPQEQAQSAVSSTPVEKTGEGQQSADHERVPSRFEQRMAARKAEGLPDKPHVADARASEAAARSKAMSQSQAPSQSL